MSKFMWFAAVWVPSAGVALIVAMQATFTANLVSDMGPATSASLLAGKPWLVVWFAFALLLAAIVATANWLLRGRPRLAATVGAGASIIVLGLLYAIFVAQPMSSVVNGF